MGSAISCVEDREKASEQLIAKCREISEQNPNNRACKFALQYLDSEHAKSLSNEDFHRFYGCIKTGIENPDSSLGCYATSPNDYSDFHGFFDAVIRDYHGDTSGKKAHVTDWETKDEKYDVEVLGIESLSMRVRVGRNLEGFCLPASMTKEMRIEFEKKMLKVFDKLEGGVYHSLSPDFGDNEPNPNLISEELYKSLVEDHIMFKDMSSDSYLNSAGISSDWPYGRGCWVSDDKARVIWVGEEDQLRIMSMKKGTNLLEVFTDLKKMLDTIESIDGVKFASHQDYGYLTSCPSNLGTGMRASVHMKVPALTSDGTDTMLKHLCKPLGFSVRGTGGEHTPIVDGTVDISPSSRLFISEGSIISDLYSGIKDIALIEKNIVSNIESLNKIKTVVTAREKDSSSAPRVAEEALASPKAAERENESLDDVEKSLKADSSGNQSSILNKQESIDPPTVERKSEDAGKPSDEPNFKKDTNEGTVLAESRDEIVNYVLIENAARDDKEKEAAAECIEDMKDQVKSSKNKGNSLAGQSVQNLNLSPSPLLSITNE